MFPQTAIDHLFILLNERRPSSFCCSRSVAVVRPRCLEGETLSQGKEVLAYSSLSSQQFSMACFFVLFCFEFPVLIYTGWLSQLGLLQIPRGKKPNWTTRFSIHLSIIWVPDVSRRARVWSPKKQEVGWRGVPQHPGCSEH